MNLVRTSLNLWLESDIRGAPSLAVMQGRCRLGLRIALNYAGTGCELIAHRLRVCSPLVTFPAQLAPVSCSHFPLSFLLLLLCT
jgi:hypothetical protein